VTVGSGLDEPVATLLQVKVDADHPRPKVKVLLYQLQDLPVRNLARAIGVYKHRQGLRHTNGIRDLHDDTACKPAGNNALGSLPGNVGTTAVNLGWILARESTTSVGSPTTIGVDDDLATSESSITMRATNDKAAGWVQVEDGLFVKVLRRNHRLDNMLLEVCSNLVIGDSLVMLGGDQDGVHTDGDHGAALIAVLDSDLGLAVRPDPGTGAILAYLGEASADLGGKHMAEGHELRGLISSITKHDALVTSTDILRALGEVSMHALGDVRRLLLDVHKHLAAVSVKANIIRDEANVAAGVTHNLLVVNGGLRGDLTKNHDHVGLGACLAGNLAVGVLRQAGIEHGVRDLVTELVGVALVHGLRGEEESLGRHFLLGGDTLPLAPPTLLLPPRLLVR